MKTDWFYDERIDCVCWYPYVPMTSQAVLHHWLVMKCPRHSPLPEYRDAIKEYIAYLDRFK